MGRKGGRIRLYDLGSGLGLNDVRDFLRDTFGPSVSCSNPRPLVAESRLPALARRLLGYRIPDPGRLGTLGGRPSRGDIETAARILGGSSTGGERRELLLSGIGLETELGPLLGPSRFGNGVMDIVFTSALACTWEPSDCRYHARTVVCGFPSIVSTSGAVEGPARPRGFYVARMMGLSEEEARRKYIGRFLEHGDERLTEVAKGLAAQAVFYHLTGDPFCEKELCRLFNARWQEQLVGSQLESGRFCEVHVRFLKELRRPRAKR